MKSIFKNSIIVAALLFGAASVSNAQVKIGTDPTNIGANSNLEVQAANGNKTIVDKATGQVTIQDGTQGLNKVLTSDANGASSWKFATGTLSPEVLISAQRTTAQTIAATGVTPLIYTNELFDDGSNFTLPSTFVAPSDGRYMVLLTVASGNISVMAGRGISLTVVGSQNFTRLLETGRVDPGDGVCYSATTILALKAGDQVTTNANGYGAAYPLISADLQIMKVGN